MTVGSLFAGIGGFDLGFQRAGFDIRWQVEIDPFCRAVLEQHWPTVRRYEDVRKVGRELERVNVICGGFPCQDISFAGRMRGMAGQRSGLWAEYLRIVCELRPQYIVVENVSALLRLGIARVVGDLAEIGYDSEWDCFPAAAFGAPHIRDRVFIMAYPQRDGWDKDAAPRFAGKLGGATLEASTQRAAKTTVSRDCGQGVSLWADSSESGSDDSRNIETTSGHGGDAWLPEPEMGRMVDGIPEPLDSLHGLGNAIVPQIAEWIARRILEVEGARAA